MKKFLIGIVFLLISLGLIIYNEIRNNRGYQTNIHEITNSASKTENIKVYLKATYIAGSLKNDNNFGYYVVFGDGVQYLIYINNKTASEINSYLLDYPEESYEIKGITKIIPEELVESGKEFVKKWLDENHHHENSEEHSHDITTEEFHHYFGYVYLDSNLDNHINYLVYITSFIGIVLVMSFIVKKYRLL